MSCPIKVNSKAIELTVHNSCYCVLDLLCVTYLATIEQKIGIQVSGFQMVTENAYSSTVDCGSWISNLDPTNPSGPTLKSNLSPVESSEIESITK